MNEAYVSFDTAKLLREKDFDWGCCSYWCIFPNGDRVHTDCGHFANHNENETGRFVSRPTQQMACRWLRKEHNIHIEPHFLRESGDYVYDIIHSPLRFDDIHSFPIVFNTTEDAVEAALQYVLKNLI